MEGTTLPLCLVQLWNLLQSHPGDLLLYHKLQPIPNLDPFFGFKLKPAIAGFYRHHSFSFKAFNQGPEPLKHSMVATIRGLHQLDD